MTNGIPEGVIDGRKTVAAAGTAEAIGSPQVIRGVLVTALEDNTGTVVVGGTTVDATLATRRGTPLEPGESVSIDAWNLGSVYIDALNNDDGVSWTALGVE